MVSKATLARTWLGVHAVAGLGLAVLAFVLLADVETGWRLFGMLVVVAAWAALGVLGLVLVLSGRDAADGARSARDAVRDVERVGRDVERLRADVRAGRDRVQAMETSLAADLDDLASALAEARQQVRDLDEHLDRVGTAIEQVGLDTSRGLSAGTVRLDEVVDRLRGRPDRMDPPK